jgi:hypothetical protein
MPLLLASQQSSLNACLAVLIFGLVLGLFGHIVRSRTLIITGILLIGGISAYFSFVLQPH